MTILLLIWVHKHADFFFSAIQKNKCLTLVPYEFLNQLIADISKYLVDNIKQTKKMFFSAKSLYMTTIWYNELSRNPSFYQIYPYPSVCNHIVKQ